MAGYLQTYSATHKGKPFTALCVVQAAYRLLTLQDNIGRLLNKKPRPSIE